MSHHILFNTYEGLYGWREKTVTYVPTFDTQKSNEVFTVRPATSHTGFFLPTLDSKHTTVVDEGWCRLRVFHVSYYPTPVSTLGRCKVVGSNIRAPLRVLSGSDQYI